MNTNNKSYTLTFDIYALYWQYDEKKMKYIFTPKSTQTHTDEDTSGYSFDLINEIFILNF